MSPLTQQLNVETFGPYQVGQLCAGTPIDEIVGVDIVTLAPNTETDVHLHREAETIIYVLEGSATLVVGAEKIALAVGARASVPKSSPHGFVSGDEPFVFVSIQCPPILHKASGKLDLVPVKEA